jgi:hypothetical protein
MVSVTSPQGLVVNLPLAPPSPITSLAPSAAQVQSVSAQLEAAAAAAKRMEVENRGQSARRKAEGAMAQQDWTLARTQLDVALEAAQQLQDTNVEEDLERMCRIVDQALDQTVRVAHATDGRTHWRTDSDAREPSSDHLPIEQERRGGAVRAAPPGLQAQPEAGNGPPEPQLPNAQKASFGPSFVSSPPKEAQQIISSQVGATQSLERSPIVSQPPVGVTPSPLPQRDPDLLSLPPLVGEQDDRELYMRSAQAPGLLAPPFPSGPSLPNVGADASAYVSPSRPSLPNAGADIWQQESDPSHEPLSPEATANAALAAVRQREEDYWGHINPGNKGDGMIKVSMLNPADGSRKPADNIDHWQACNDAGELMFDLDAMGPGMEDVTGGLLGGAMFGLASLTDNTRRSSAFLLSVNASLSQGDLDRILAFCKRGVVNGTYNPEAANGLMV